MAGGAGHGPWSEIPKTIIFTDSLKDASAVYRYLLTTLKENAYVNRENKFANRILDMFHSHSDEDSRTRVQTLFPADSHIRVVVATVALGIGVNIRDIRIVVHWGLQNSILVFWQEVGRAGRDGLPAVEVACAKTGTGSYEGDVWDAFETQGCTRKHLLRHFLGSGVPTAPTCGCHCCSHCAEQCKCSAVSLRDRVFAL